MSRDYFYLILEPDVPEKIKKNKKRERCTFYTRYLGLKFNKKVETYHNQFIYYSVFCQNIR
jgi:hypothetical protein